MLQECGESLGTILENLYFVWNKKHKRKSCCKLQEEKFINN